MSTLLSSTTVTATRRLRVEAYGQAAGQVVSLQWLEGDDDPHFETWDAGAVDAVVEAKQVLRDAMSALCVGPAAWAQLPADDRADRLQGLSAAGRRGSPAIPATST